MAQQTDNTLKTYFETGDFPTQQQFWDFIDSKLSRGEAIPMTAVIGLVAALQNKADAGTGVGSNDGNNYPTSLAFDPTTGILSINRSGLAAITVDTGLGSSDNVSHKIISSRASGSIPLPVGSAGNISFSDANFEAHTTQADYNAGRYPSYSFWIDNVDAGTLYYRPVQESVSLNRFELWVLGIQGTHKRLMFADDNNSTLQNDAGYITSGSQNWPDQLQYKVFSGPTSAADGIPQPPTFKPIDHNYISDFKSAARAAMRDYAGSVLLNGNGSSISYSFSHGLPGVTGGSLLFLTARSSDTQIAYSGALTSTNITINFKTAPPAGTNNLAFDWMIVP